MIAALYVETDGCYFGLHDVDPWDQRRDARKYSGPWPVVAHPPCQRWGRFWHGSTRKPHQYKLGDDGGCFESALRAVLRWGGVLEHPAHSKAWDAFGLLKPTHGKGWQRDDMGHPCTGYWTCHVEQGHYGHMSRKPTWLLANTMGKGPPPELNWTKGDQRLPAWMVERYGYEKARRIGVVAMVGGKDKTRIRNATPPQFRDVLLDIARLASQHRAAALAQPAEPAALTDEEIGRLHDPHLGMSCWWICPRCGTANAPTTPYCYRCVPGVAQVAKDTTCANPLQHQPVTTNTVPLADCHGQQIRSKA